MHFFHKYGEWVRIQSIDYYGYGDNMPHSTLMVYKGTCIKCGTLKFKKIET